MSEAAVKSGKTERAVDKAVRIVGVSKEFGGVSAVKDVSIDIDAGDFFSLLGPSGCGKTTLLRMIAGFEFPTSGQVLIAGKDMAKVPAHRRPVNMVFQSYALFPHLSVVDNIAFGLQVQKSCPAAEIPERVKWALDLVRLKGKEDRYPRELSGGQQQRVAFARAIVNRPAVLLLDEPLSALDPKVRDEMQEELARFKKNLDITFVMVTHDQSEALALSDKIAVLSAGHLEQLGTPQEIYENPRTIFVADFIGETNVFSGTVVGLESQLVRVKIGDNVELSAAAPSFTVTTGSEVDIWIRSNDVHLLADADGIGDGANRLPARVTTCSYQGTVSEYKLRISDQVKLTALCRNQPGNEFPEDMDVFASISYRSVQILVRTTSDTE